MSRFALEAPQVDPSLRHRRGSVDLRIVDASGAPVVNQMVRVEQVRHQFGFGCIGFDFIPLASGVGLDAGERERLEALAEQSASVFNWTTLPFYWRQFEPVQGRPRTDELHAAAEWFVDRGLKVKGHPLVWHSVGAPWLTDLPSERIEELLRERIQRDVTDFRGLIDSWDVVNEAVIMPVFDKEPNGLTKLSRAIGQLGVIRLAFEEARAANPEAELLLNDFDMSSAYDTLLEGVLEAGIEVDALGLQSHMHQGAWGAQKTERILEKFSRYGLPIHFTETTLLSGDHMPTEIVDLNDHQVNSWPSTSQGEERQAADLEEHLRCLFAHPSVHAMTYWGLSDKGMWLGAPGGLIGTDGSPKPAFEVMRRLVKGEWWDAPREVVTDESGHVRIDGWKGIHQASCGAGWAEFQIGEKFSELRLDMTGSALSSSTSCSNCYKNCLTAG